MQMRTLAVLLTSSLTLGFAQAAPLKTDMNKSSVTAVFKQMGVPVEGKFKKFVAKIDFDAAKPDNSKAQVEIDMSGFDLGAPDFNAEVLKPEWFSSAKFPKASFISSSIKATSASQLNVIGKLSIKGKSIDVSFPLSLKKEGAQQVFDGNLPIKRLSFNIGEGEWKDTGMVADEVIIKFHINATP